MPLKLFGFIFCLFFSAYDHPVVNVDDLSGIYITKQDFLRGVPQFESKDRIKEKTGLLWSDPGFEAEGIIRIGSRSAGFRTFEPGTIYGFVLSGITYLYTSSLKKYLAVLADKPPVYFFVKEQVYSVHRPLIGQVLLFSTSLEDPPEEFTKENISRHFRNDELTAKQLRALHDQINKKPYGLFRSDFFSCAKLIREYSSKIKVQMPQVK